MAINEKVSVDIVFNPDTKQLEKITKEIGEDNKIKISVDKPDIKQLEGPFKDLQEKFATMANGGFSKGISQFGEAFKTATSISGQGGDILTSLAGGFSKIGSEGAIAAEGVVAAGTAALSATVAVGALAIATGVALVTAIEKGISSYTKFLSSIQETARSMQSATAGFNDYSNNLTTVGDKTEYVRLKNLALNAGLNMSGEELSRISNSINNYSVVLGDAAAATDLHTRAMSGDIQAARLLGAQVDEYASKQEIAIATQRALTAEQQKNGDVASSLSQEWDKFGSNLSIIWEGLKTAVLTSVTVAFSPLIATGYVVFEVFSKIVSVVAQAVTGLGQIAMTIASGLGFDQLNRKAEEYAQRQAAQAQRENGIAAQRRANAAESIHDLEQQIALNNTQLGVLNGTIPVENNIFSLRERQAATQRELTEIQTDFARRLREGNMSDEERNSFLQRQITKQQTLLGLTREIKDAQNLTTNFQNIMSEHSRQILLYELGISRTKPEQVNWELQLATTRARINMLEREALTATNERRAAIRNELNDLGNLAIAQAQGQRADRERADREIENAKQRATQAAQLAEQNNQIRLQNNQTELSMRYANELARARGEAYRTDIDSIDVVQRRQQIEAGLNGLYAYRGQTVQQEAARLATIQRLTEQLNNLRGIEEAQQERAQQLAIQRKQQESQAATIAERDSRAAITTAIRLGEINLTRLNMYDSIIQRQREGISITSAEREYLERYNNAARMRLEYGNLINSQIDEQRTIIANSKPGTQEKLAAEERLNQLLAQRIGLQREDQDRSQRQSIMTSRLGKALGGLAENYTDVGDAAQGLGSMVLNQLGSAFSNMISTVIEGKVSFGEALAEMAKSMLASLAQMAGSQALFQLATGFAKLAINDIPGSTAAFTSAGMFAAVAAVAGGISAAIPSSNQQSGGGGGSSGGVSTPTTPESSSRNSGPMVINVTVGGSLSTDKDIQKAVAHSLYAYEERMGTRRR